LIVSVFARVVASDVTSQRTNVKTIAVISEPSKEIAPEYEAVAVATQERRVIVGLRINETNVRIQLTGENGRFHSFLKRDLDELKVQKKSPMPENFGELLTVKEWRGVDCDVFAQARGAGGLDGDPVH